MKCPKCKNTFETDVQSAFRSADTYDSQVKALSSCCNTIIEITPIRVFSLSIADGAIEDSWGNKP